MCLLWFDIGQAAGTHESHLLAFSGSRLGRGEGKKKKNEMLMNWDEDQERTL